MGEKDSAFSIFVIAKLYSIFFINTSVVCVKSRDRFCKFKSGWSENLSEVDFNLCSIENYMNYVFYSVLALSHFVSLEKSLT